MTKNPHIIAGLNMIMVTQVEVKGMIAKNMTVTNTPLPNKIKSKGRKIPRIN